MITHPLPASLGFCALIPGFLSAGECQALIDRGEAQGFLGADSDYPPSYRNNERLVMDDPALAERLAARLRASVPAEMLADEADGVRWKMRGVNERLRWCRYRPGQAFHIHQDGVHHRGPTLRSRLTFMIYLTDGDAFEGGDTVFFADGPRATPEGEAQPPVVARVRPRAGSLILFDHRIWHAGEAVTRGVKHIVRSDVMFESVGETGGASCHCDEHQGYVWTLCALPGERLASGGRDTAIRLWNARGDAAGVLRGHRQSVLGLAMLDARRLVSVSRDRTLRVWNVDTGACEQVFHPHAAAILSVTTWRGLIVTGGADGAVRATRP
jgi:predicted 2-oxoglutarate/Fe(II)-dependent dioxygenase YbiX